MKKTWLTISILIMSIVAFQRGLLFTKAKPEQVNSAIKKSLHLLAYSSHDFLSNSDGCHSCHGQAISAVAFTMAKEKGFDVSSVEWKEAIDSMTNNGHGGRSTFAECTDPVALAIGGGYTLWAMSINKVKADKDIHLAIHDMMNRQSRDGSWRSPSTRPPLEGSVYTATALVSYCILAYAPEIWKNKANSCIDKSRNWLEKQTPITNEEKTFQLLGLVWTKANPEIIQHQAQQLIASQRPDGGWSQLTSLESDAYATGQSLYALNLSGQLSVENPIYERAVSFLISKQKSDGSWFVKSRSHAGVPFVDSGFPYGDNQYISAAGTGWATIALTQTIK